jgi:hypothetical protein
MKIDTETLGVLDQCTTDGNILFLPQDQLERSLYQKVNKVLECLGGKWNRSKHGHIFAMDPAELIEEAVLTGEVTDAKKEFQFFETPKDIVKQMIELADLRPEDRILEPSAGRGAIAFEIIKISPKVDVVELNPESFKALIGYFQNEVQHDFLSLKNVIGYNKIIMNPPFSKQQDIDHVLHAWGFLKTGGTLVSIMSEGTFFRQNQKAKDFRKLLEQVGYSIPLDEGAFKASGTMVRTRIVVMQK